jgi:hypothetical protein|tara:strand:+ start:1566 stop:1874 length:309 start_codon:yes stop_codon:yes gene_type:complete
MDPELILKQSLEININYIKAHDKINFNLEEFKNTMKVKYLELFNEYSTIFNISVGPSYDFLRLKKMLILANKIKTNEITEHSASVQVGQILVDEIVKPQLKK